MKYLGFRFIAVAAIFHSFPLWGVDFEEMHDPLLGLRIDQERISSLSPVAESDCEYFKQSHPCWFFSQYVNEGKKYGLASNLVPIFTDEDSPRLLGYEENVGGGWIFILDVKSKEIKMLIATDVVMDSPNDFGLSVETVNGLVKNYIENLTKVYGGKVELQNEIDRQIVDSTYIYPIVKQIFESDGFKFD